MTIRRVRKISTDEENFRLVSLGEFQTIRRDPIEPVPQETLIVKVFRVTGYDPDCDGSLMARLEEVDDRGRPTGWEENCVGLHPNTTWVIDDPTDLDRA